MTLFGLHFLRPLVLLLLLPIGGLALRLWRRPSGLGDWVGQIDPPLLAAMETMGMTGGAGSRLRPMLLVAALTALALALAGPATPKREATSYRNLDGVIFVLDASAETVESDDWQQMVTLLRSGLTAMGSRPAALIVFGEDAYVALDMTYDLRELGMTVALIAPDTVPTSRAKLSPDPAKGLALATDLIGQGNLLAGDTVLITRVPPSANAGNPLTNTRLTVAMPKPAQAEPLARASGGTPLSLTDVEALQSILGTSLQRRLEAQGVPLNFYADQGRWLILLAMFPVFLLMMGRRE